jgi:hypothetical protein
MFNKKTIGSTCVCMYIYIPEATRYGTVFVISSTSSPIWWWPYSSPSQLIPTCQPAAVTHACLRLQLHASVGLRARESCHHHPEANSLPREPSISATSTPINSSPERERMADGMYRKLLETRERENQLARRRVMSDHKPSNKNLLISDPCLVNKLAFSCRFY